jgi:hypothetical protein
MPDLLPYMGARELPHLPPLGSPSAIHMHYRLVMDGSVTVKIILIVIALTMLVAGSVLLFLGVADLARRRSGTRKKEPPATETENHRRAA